MMSHPRGALTKKKGILDNNAGAERAF